MSGMSGMFNEDQLAHMSSLGKVPREERCASGWHILPDSPTGKRHPGMAERCTCRPAPDSAPEQPREENDAAS